MSALRLVGVILIAGGLLAFFGVRLENKGIPRHAWDTNELFRYYGGPPAAILGLLFILFGCGGGSLPEPTDPVTVEVIACEPTLGGTPGQYLQLKTWRTEIGVCEAAMAEDGARRAIRNMAERDVDRLGQEFDIYRVQGRIDCYCGPVCQEMTELVERARQTGLFCGP